MDIARSLNTKFFKPLNSFNEDKAQHILNKRANSKLNYVVGIFADSLKDHWEIIEDGFLYKKIALKDLNYLRELKLSYYLQNRFFARTYDLRFDFQIPIARKDGAEFDLSYSGKTQIKGAMFKMIAGEEADAGLLERLNSKFICDRLLKLDFLDLKIKYSTREGIWKICAESIIGSAAWNFIPPMFQVIKPTPQECILIIELFQLILDALASDGENKAIDCP